MIEEAPCKVRPDYVFNKVKSVDSDGEFSPSRMVGAQDVDEGSTLVGEHQSTVVAADAAAMSIEDEEQLRRGQNRGFFQKDAVLVSRKQLVESNEMLQRTNALTLAISA